jgi:hypothetical protein
MKTIYQISKEYKIPLKKVKEMFEAGCLNALTASNPFEDIVISLRKANQLSSYHRTLLLRNPTWLKLMGEDLVWFAKNNLKPLGDAIGESLPLDAIPHALIDGAATNDENRISQFARWIASVIPEKGCDYHYVAVRALLNVPEHLLEFTAQRVSRAIAKARQDPALEGMSATENRVTQFFQKQFDL